MEKPWENHGKTMGKPRENHGKPMGKPENGPRKDGFLGDHFWLCLTKPRGNMNAFHHPLVDHVYFPTQMAIECINVSMYPNFQTNPTHLTLKTYIIYLLKSPLLMAKSTYFMAESQNPGTRTVPVQIAAIAG